MAKNQRHTAWAHHHVQYRVGVESEIPDADVPITEKSQLIELFLAHIVETGGLE